VKTKADWFLPENQRWVLERRMAYLVRQHMRATEAGKDTSYSVHALTMAHSDYTYWKGFWDVVKGANTSFAKSLKPMAQVVCPWQC
jgi:acyl-CoA oxidase